MTRIAIESFQAKNEQLAALSEKYKYEPWRLRIFDMQRASVKLVDPPGQMLPKELQAQYRFATLTMQANGFTFTTSDPSAPTPTLNCLDTPYEVKAGEGAALQLTYEGRPVNEFESLRLMEIMGKPAKHYFAFKEAQTGSGLPTYLVVNPYDDCAYRCKYCSRLPYFGKNGHGYQANLLNTIAEVTQGVSAPQEVRFINIITGSLKDPESDLALCRAVVAAFDAAGFGHCEYGFYTTNLTSKEHLKILRELRVVVLTVTVEVTSPQSRLRLHEPGNPKQRLHFENIIALIQQAEEIFPYVNTTLMLGYEPADVLKRNLETLADETQTTVNHYIPRIWLKNQLELLHPTARDLEYYVDLMAFAERGINAGRKTIGSFFEERFSIPRFQLRYRS